MKFKTIGQAKRDHNLSYLGAIGSNTKVIKSEKIGVMTYLLHLLPHNLSGYQVCSMSTKECRLGCLNMSGRAKMPVSQINIIKARLTKTKLFFEDRKYFFDWLIAELKNGQTKARKKDMEYSVRLNGTSDIHWQAFKHNGFNIFEHFPNVQFYDYTKIAKKFRNLPENYHLTFSYTGNNWNECEPLLESNNNVAVIFDVPKSKPLPTTFKGYQVIDGDITDYRPADPKGVIVGLRFKTVADRKVSKEIQNSIFVTKPIYNFK